MGTSCKNMIVVDNDLTDWWTSKYYNTIQSWGIQKNRQAATPNNNTTKFNQTY